MSVCKEIKGYSRRHERVADFFSVMAVALLFGTLYVAIAYHQMILGWLQQDVIINSALAISALVADVFFIYVFLNIGSAKFADENEGCFHTFSGRRSGSGSVGTMFTSWLRHMEHVGKKHR
jgi:hypothetical protein